MIFLSGSCQGESQANVWLVSGWFLVVYDIFCLVLVRLITCTSYLLLCARFLISSLPLCPVQLFIIASFKSVIDLKRSNIFPVKSQLNLDGLKCSIILKLR